MPEDPFEFTADFECPVCTETLETAEAVYDHLRLHDLDIDELDSARTRSDDVT